MNRSLVQLQVSQRMRGRVMSIDLMSHGLMPLGILPVGYVAEQNGVHVGLMLSGAILAVFSLVLMSALGAVRRIDTGYQVQSEKPEHMEKITAAPSNTA